VSAQEYRENAQECLGWARTARTERERDEDEVRAKADELETPRRDS
jgi:hypothetical protein